MKKIFYSFLILLSACGTQPILRPADTLKAGESEFTSGFALNNLRQGLPLFRLDYGVSDHLEIGAQSETYSIFGGVRAGLFQSETSALALALGLQAGLMQSLRSYTPFDEWEDRGVLSPNLTIGKKVGDVHFYLGYRAFWELHEFRYGAGAIKGGLRVPIRDRLAATAEAGFTHYLRSGHFLAHLFETALGISVGL